MNKKKELLKERFKHEITILTGNLERRRVVAMAEFNKEKQMIDTFEATIDIIVDNVMDMDEEW